MRGTAVKQGDGAILIPAGDCASINLCAFATHRPLANALMLFRGTSRTVRHRSMAQHLASKSLYQCTSNAQPCQLKVLSGTLITTTLLKEGPIECATSRWRFSHTNWPASKGENSDNIKHSIGEKDIYELRD